MPSSSIPSSNGCQVFRSTAVSTLITIAGWALSGRLMLRLPGPGQHQTGSYSVAWALATADIAAPGHQPVVCQRIGDQLGGFEIQRRAANQHHKRDIADVAGWTHLRQRAQGVGHKHAL